MADRCFTLDPGWYAPIGSLPSGTLPSGANLTSVSRLPSAIIWTFPDEIGQGTNK